MNDGVTVILFSMWVDGFWSVISFCMDLHFGLICFYKSQKQSVLLDIFCEPCFIMYHMGILFTSKCRVNLLKIKLLAYMHLLFEFSYAERDNTLLFTHLIDYLSSYDFNELLSHCLAAGECAERLKERKKKKVTFSKMTVGHENALV